MSTHNIHSNEYPQHMFLWRNKENLFHCKSKMARVVTLMMPWMLQRSGTKTMKQKWAASSQNQHPPSLIRVFAVHMKKAWVLSYPLSTQQRLIRLGGCPGWSESLLGAQSFCWFCHGAAQMDFVTKVKSSLCGSHFVLSHYKLAGY